MLWTDQPDRNPIGRRKRRKVYDYILIVEDDNDINEMLAEFLDMHGLRRGSWNCSRR